MVNIKKIISNKSHPIWVFIQQFAVRGLLALKFLLIARFLGPHDMGIITAALISMTLAEALTDIGIMQAVVQNKNKMDNYRVIWTLQFIRGLFITFVMLLFNELLIFLFQEPDLRNLLLLISFVPLIKNSISVDYYFQIRKKNFRDISIIFTISSIIDLLSSVTLVLIFKDPIYAIIPLLISEVFKTIFTHIVFKCTISFDFRFYLIKDILSYGRWIWLNSISSFLVNQFDKLLASTFLGTKSLGFYQMSQKLTQLAVADISFAAGQYLFPQFSHYNRINNYGNALKKYYANSMLMMITFSIVMSSFVIVYSQEIILIFLGEQWTSIINLLKIMIIASSLSAIINISIVYTRAIGKPKKVTIASYIQLLIFVMLCLLLVNPLKEYGLAISVIISYLLGLLFLNIRFNRKRIYIIRSVKENILILLLSLGTIFLMILSKQLLPMYLGFTSSLVIFTILLAIFGIKFKKLGEI